MANSAAAALPISQMVSSARQTAAEAASRAAASRTAAAAAWARVAGMVAESAAAVSAAQAAANSAGVAVTASSNALRPAFVDLAPSYSTLTLNTDPLSTRLGATAAGPTRPPPEVEVEAGLPTYEEAITMKANFSMS